jgi:hypothetical protein
VIQQEMLDTLIMAGFETYILIDHERARKLLEKFPGSIMFVNIDEKLRESEWQKYIQSVMDDPKTKDCRLGITSYNADKDLMKKYLMEIQVPCGYIQLKLGLKESIKIMLQVLVATEAKGRRKYIRAECEDDINAIMNYTSRSNKIQANVLGKVQEKVEGRIMDISSAGIAVKIENFSELALNSILPDVQIKLRSGLFMTDLMFMGKRRDLPHVYIFLFRNLNEENKLIVHKFIKLCLQKYINNLQI